MDETPTNDESTRAPATDAEQPAANAAQPRQVTSDDFLVPGPTPESNAGLGRWGLSWLIFSLVLIVVMLGMSYVCFWLAVTAGLI